MMVSIVYPLVFFLFRTFWTYFQILHLLSQQSILRTLMKITFWFCLTATFHCPSYILAVCAV